MRLLVRYSVLKQFNEHGTGLVFGSAFQLVVAHPGGFADVVDGADIVPLRTLGCDVAGLNLASSAPTIVVEVGFHPDAAGSSVVMK